MTASPEFRHSVVVNDGGMSRVVRFPSSRRKRLPLRSFCYVVVNLPPDLQLCGQHPQLIERLERDWGAGLSALSCSTGDFRAALKRGRETLGHVWAEMYSLCLDKISLGCDLGHIEFQEEVKAWEVGDEAVEYLVRLFYSHEFPRELGGLEYFTSGYINAALEGTDFDIQALLDEKIRHRVVDRPERAADSMSC